MGMAVSTFYCKTLAVTVSGLIQTKAFHNAIAAVYNG
jgi:hypothetical protein